MRLVDGCAIRSRAAVAFSARLAGVLAAILALTGCAGNYAVGIPRADSAAGGVTVRFSGTLFAFGYGVPPIPIPKNIYMCEPWRWTAVIDVKQATPQVPPIVNGARIKVIFDNPTRFFETNDLVLSGKVQKALTVWRGKDGFLHAVSTVEPARRE